MNTIIGDGMMQIGGALRPFYIGTRQTALFCELQKEGFDLQDYNKLFMEVGLNQFYAKEKRDKGETYTPAGRKALTPTENSQFLYSALVAGAKREGRPVDFDVDTVSDWIDEAEASGDEQALAEAAKPLLTHYQLLTLRINRQAARPGNAPAPTLTAQRGGKTKPAPKRKTPKS
jgi:hypothetical protein